MDFGQVTMPQGSALSGMCATGSSLAASTTTTSSANAAEARQSTISPAASRVMTQRLKGSGPDMRVAFVEARRSLRELRAFYGVSVPMVIRVAQR